ncbi:LLM class oxidoreductase [Cohaesibacter celericrescens]|uniref:LLM class flavin-dependent oxidoreductase n=1 Tax=Cohaesibacter celericrescens TaxID=2067669 RepID=A0A2N5XVP0_9HYPH|nr:LLM class oxidoreductase [Cohaesibacter celericrescens]PLW78547.1 LLM class flavin-dependent oxidoreductase [Cohaesibacter celericrescens]
MNTMSTATEFELINPGYNRTFKPSRLSIGLVVPIVQYADSPVPDMTGHIARAQLAEELGFSALWLRDVPFNVPSFGDAGQIYDPFVYLGALSATTHHIALGVASVVLPLRHPAHVAKAAASADVMSGGRLLLGVASGDRPDEYPALNSSFPDRGERFRDSVDYIRAASTHYPQFENGYGSLTGNMDLLPKPEGSRLPLLITGGSQQHPDWIAQNGDGWMTYPRDAISQGRVVTDYRRRVADAGGKDKPVMQSLYIDLLEDTNAAAHPIHLGFRSGSRFLCSYLEEIRALGINHVALNLRFNSADIETTLKRLADEVLPGFTA